MSPTSSPTRAPYLKAAEQLRKNSEQWRAYESQGNCVLLAGPGSGKTKTLTVKLARILAEDVSPPRGVACITYSNECVRELERRLATLGVAESARVFIGTTHSFALKNILIPYGQLAGLDLPASLAVANDSQRESALATAVERHVGVQRWLGEWRTKCFCYRRTHLDREAPSWRGTDSDLAAICETYEELLHKQGIVDFDDMVLAGLRLLEGHAWIRQAIRAKFPVVVVDEYQDLGLPLHRTVLSLIEAGVRVFTVGDSDQSIYGFTGADPKLLRDLSERDDVEQVRLRLNYRCGEAILQASKVTLTEDRDYESGSEHEGTISFYQLTDGIEEQAEYICSKIIPGILERNAASELGEIAVLYPDRYDGDVIAEAAAEAGFKFVRIDKGAPYPRSPLTRWLEECAAWCAGGWRVGHPRLSRILRRWAGFNSRLASPSERRAARLQLVHFLFEMRRPGLPLGRWLTDFDSSCLREALKGEPALADQRSVLDAMLKACERKRAMAKWSVEVFGGKTGRPDHLNLITLHSAKGREFDAVVMMGLEEGKWTLRTQNPDSRRLFYVGLTRARHEVHLTCSGFFHTSRGHRRSFGPSTFLLEIYRALNPEDAD